MVCERCEWLVCGGAAGAVSPPPEELPVDDPLREAPPLAVPPLAVPPLAVPL
ncbi:hypothetical protein GCM10023175_62930 [Pseudonocardia xishanensis]|uniref:Uncharacterized protein n=1 Tax=Pseudonocardia xishanensis TaxID=630995 RepID=A0ABP8S3C6_9PSEU